MVASDNVSHAMQGVIACNVTSGVIAAQYEDGSSNIWNGNAGVFAVFWKTGQGSATEGVTNGTAIKFPLPSSTHVALTFISSIASGTAFGLPAGFTTSNSYLTSAMTGWTHSGSNNSQGWNCSADSGLTVTAYYRDGSGNQWNGSASGFAVGGTGGGTGGNLEWFNGNGVTGSTEPIWLPNPGDITPDGSAHWTNLGPGKWIKNTAYALGSVVIGTPSSAGTPTQVYVATTAGTSDPANEPSWVAGRNLQVQDGTVVWTCEGRILGWNDIGPNTNLSSASVITDPNSYLQQVTHQGKTGTTEPSEWQTELGALTDDGTMQWVNIGAFAPAGTGAVQYGYAYENSVTDDISNMSPPSDPITVTLGNQVTIQGQGSGQAGVDKIPIYRTAQDGSTFLFLDSIPNPGGGKTWTYVDNIPDSGLNAEIQAQVGGEGTPLPAGATCLAYHLQRIFAAVGNVVYVSSGPDAVASTSSGNAGFDTFLTAQSKITRFWTCSLGLVVFTVRDAYIILGSGTPADPLYMVVFIEQIPLLHYDAFTINKTTPMLMQGNNMVIALDPGAGILEIGFPIADLFETQFDPTAAFVTYHSQSSKENALYVANGNGYWYRMNTNNAPEQGSAWSPRAEIAGMGCVQSVEVEPGKNLLLWGGTTAVPRSCRGT